MTEYNESLLDMMQQTEEESYLRKVVHFLMMTGVTAEVHDPGHGNALQIVFPVGNTEHEFYASSGGPECDFNFQIVDLRNGKADTFVDLPWGRPATAAYIIFKYHESVTTEAEYFTSNYYNDAWKCPCGNDVMNEGFGAVDLKTGVKVEPNPGEWDGRSVGCLSCGRIADELTHEVNPNSTGDEYDAYRVTVIGHPNPNPNPSN